MKNRVYIVRTDEFDCVEDAIKKGACYRFDIYDANSRLLIEDLKDCIQTVANCIHADMAKTRGFVKVGSQFVELETYLNHHLAGSLV